MHPWCKLVFASFLLSHNGAAEAEVFEQDSWKTCSLSSEMQACSNTPQDLSGFLQHQIIHSSRDPSVMLASQVDHVASRQPTVGSMLQNGRVGNMSGGRAAVDRAVGIAGNTLSGDGAKCLGFLPLNQIMWLGMFQALPACNRQGPASKPLEVSLLGEGFGQVRPVRDRSGEAVAPVFFLVAYIVIAFMMISIALRGTLCPDRSQRTSPEDDAQRRPEADAWAQNCLRWLSVSWADRWIISWGSLRHSRRRRWEHLGRIASPEDESAACFDLFDRLWQEEIAARGLTDASLVKVIVQFVTLRKTCLILICVALEGCLRYFCPILIVQWLLGYLALLYEFRAMGQQLSPLTLLSPSIYTVLFFMGLPLVTAAVGNTGALLSAQVSARLRGALASAVLAKSLRLPSVEQTLTPMATPRACNLIQLIGCDIDMNIAKALPCLAKISVLLPVLIGLFLMLSRMVDWAILVSGVVVVLAAIPIAWVCLHQLRNLSTLQVHTEKRLFRLQSMILSLRQIKICYFDEEICSWLSKAREAELEAVKTHYKNLGVFRCIVSQFPKAIIMCTLGGTIWLKGQAPVSTVLLYVQMLAIFQSVMEGIMRAVPEFLHAAPSCQRIENFLKMPEVPSVDLHCDTPLELDNSLELAPDSPSGPGRGEATQQPGLHIQGSFAWDSCHGTVALRKLDLSVEAGEVVAVIGQSGSGKTSLLHAILGELHPMARDGCQRSVEGKIGFVTQAPRLCEGSVRELVKYLHPQQHNPERYQEAIWASGLYPDIKDLPNKDHTLVSSQGCTLSCGQRTRVCLARAGYASDASVVLLDDPFSAVDSSTAKHLCDQLIHGPLLQGRTRIVVCQPEFVNTLDSDRVVLMSEGRILLQGKADKVTKTTEYQSLLGQDGCQFRNIKDLKKDSIKVRRRSEQHGLPEILEDLIPVQEQEIDAPTDWSTLDHFCQMGPWTNLLACVMLFLLQTAANMMMYVVMSRWSTSGEVKDNQVWLQVQLSSYQHLQLCTWWMVNIGAYILGWMFGADFAIGIAKRSHKAFLRILMCPSVDHLHNKMSVGRIMNLGAHDVRSLDLSTFTQVTESLVLICWFLAAVFYINVVMPMYFTIVLAPFYMLLISLSTRYWNTTMPLRQLSRSCWSAVGEHLVDAEVSAITMRSYKMMDQALTQLQQLLDRQIYTELATDVVLARWLVGRASVVCGLFASCVALVAIWVPGFVDLGTIALCVTSAALVVAQIESYVEAASDIQAQVVAMGRLHELESLPQESPAELDADARYCSFTVSCERPDPEDVEYASFVQRWSRTWRSRSLEYKRVQVLHIVDNLVQQSGLGGRDDVTTVLRRVLADIILQCPKLRSTQSWHRVVAVNGVSDDAASMTLELCHGTSKDVVLQVQSSWLSGGAMLEVQGLTAGYANVPRDVLQDMDLCLERHCKLGLVGGVNSGKSTLLLCLVRLLEPRAGCVRLEGVDIKSLGLKLLRECVCIVPSDPVLFADTLQSYLDPSAQIDDDRLLEVLRALGLGSCSEQLLTAPAPRWSPGQRQLLCLARAALQDPSLLLLDDAGAALDPRGRELLQTFILQHFRYTTTIVATHHLDMILNLDVVAVMDRGMVVERGPVRELAQLQGGHFATMLASSIVGGIAD